MDGHAREKIPYLDGWRGMAIFCLLIGHFLPVRGIEMGALGVHLFFVLSGFLMTRILFLRQSPIATFYVRRIGRVFPTLYAFLMVVAAGAALLGDSSEWGRIAATATFTSNYFYTLQGASVLPLGHIWSLCVEEHSYVILSLVALAERAGWVRARTVVGLLALASAGCAVYYFFAFPDGRVNWLQRKHTEVSAFGILFAGYLLLCFHGRNVRRVPAIVYPVLALCAVAAHWWRAPLPVMVIVGVGALALGVNLLPAAPRMVQAALSLAPLRAIGTWSFSLYIWQQPFYMKVADGRMHPALGLLLTLAIGIPSFYLLEQPARQSLNRRWGARHARGLPLQPKRAA
jgi:peptidoglycan/LPS O-acetylase OafA/YrhL